ncbi:MAG: prolyl oligopeptidase family serine peptidase [Acidobacteria bacterium]|nr:prolyl oligopeptidase family serine peptidase [Acidobacteriota bacterium]
MRRNLLPLLSLLLCTGLRGAQPGGALIVERMPIDLPAFEATPPIARYATASEYAEAKADPNFLYERLLYRSNGVVVSGYLYGPKQLSGKLPAIVFSRGSLIVHNQAPLLVTMMRRLARQGFVVFAPMFRGSDGTAGHDELGGADLADLRNAIEVVNSLPSVNAGEVFLYGESRGGMMTYFALRDGFPVRAAAVYGATTDLEETLNLQDPDRKLARFLWPDYDAEREGIHESRSALRWPEKIRTPILILHGGDDSLSPRQSLRLAEALTVHRRPYSLVIFAHDDHVLTRNRHKRDQLAVEWFQQHRLAPK